MPVGDTTQQGFPNVRATFVDENGYINQAWLQLLIQLWNRTGGAPGVSSDDLAILEALTDSKPDLRQNPQQLDFFTPSQGQRGPRGFTGLIGPPGYDGVDGQDGFTIPGPQGPAGTNGTIGVNGLPGAPGLDGEDGMDGFVPGPVGPPGSSGLNGGGALTLIQSVSPSGTTTVTFSNIPQNFTHLKIIGTGRSTLAGTGTDPVAFRFNNDSGNNYAGQSLFGAGGTAGAGTTASSYIRGAELCTAGDTANEVTEFEVTIPAYANSTFWKKALGQYGVNNTAGDNEVIQVTSGKWKNTSAITRIDLTISGNWVVGSTVSLYGIGGVPGAVQTVTPPQGRLTLVTGQPVMTSDQTAKGTIYWTPYIGNSAPIYSGSAWAMFSAASDITYTLAAGAHTSTNLYDLFLYNSSGLLALGTSPAWTNSTTRSNAISMFQGIWTNTSSITLTVSGGGSTVSVAANQATYVGTFYATANGQTGMSFLPSPVAGGTNNILGLYNAYNRVKAVSLERDGTTTSWTSSNPNWEAANAGGTGSGLNNRVTFVDGLQQSPIESDFQLEVAANGAITAFPSIGCSLDSTSATPQTQSQCNSSSFILQTVTNSFNPQLGLHFVQAQQTSASSNPAQFVAVATSPTRQFYALRVSLDM